MRPDPLLVQLDWCSRQLIGHPPIPIPCLFPWLRLPLITFHVRPRLILLFLKLIAFSLKTTGLSYQVSWRWFKELGTRKIFLQHNKNYG
ncbi:hypothetical protein Zm00014a_004716 [Zea mays]|uniref:Uncharacterized protein n=1 Tax=Zea mays TaxID=4577 RepID=A0A317YA55_MAIZE|nr:hypothetical protein Zm00014a_004716 [Zea mays]